ncbi:histone deacetylase complex subunit SAP25 [Anolis sagrei]|uniref:histone deacetylase complex subunit SAP25 n=1 Tax=Anolis sagrei TaxID=38937 RepID=UPI0035214A40
MFEEPDPRHELWDEEEEEEEEEEEDPEEEEETPDCNGAEFPPWMQPDAKPTFRTPHCPTGQVTHWCHSRTLSHPSFQALYTARAHDGPRPLPGPLPVLDCGGFFYSDPTMPPGHRIYNWLSRPSQEVFLNLRLNTPPPIMSTCVSASPRPLNHGLSELEQKAVSALLELPATLTCALDTGQSLPGLEEAGDTRK